MNGSAVRNPSKSWRNIAALAVVLAVTAAIYFPMTANRFAGLDDDVYITANPLIEEFSAGNLWRILTRPYAEFYHPATLLSLAIDRAIWGENPLGYHLTDFLLHLLNTALVFWVARGLVRRGAPSGPEALARVTAAVVALLFGLHPLHVESVAWAAQRKDLLCAFFFLISIGLYLRYTEQPDSRRGRWRYRLCFGAFVLALFSKSMAVTLPAVLLLLDWYPLRRLSGWPGRNMPAGARAAWVEKWPFFVLVLAIGVATLLAQQGGRGDWGSTTPLPWRLRPFMAIYGYGFYLWKAVWPFDLTVLYPIADVRPSRPMIWVMAGALVAITAAAWLLRRRMPAFAAAWAWYLIVLAPVCGVIGFGAQGVADRYAYLPLLGPYVLVGLAVGRINLIGDRGLRPMARTATAIGIACVVAGLALLTSRQIAHWYDGETLWRRHLAIHPNHARARFNLARALQERGRIDAAIAEYEAVLEARPDSFEANTNLGALMLQRDAPAPALDYFEAALAKRPEHPGAQNNVGLALLRTRMPGKALGHFERALAIDPAYDEARINLGEAYAALGKPAQAIQSFSAVLKRKPYLPQVYESLGLAYVDAGEPAKARTAFERALSIEPRSARALIGTARLEAAANRPVSALVLLTKAARMKRDDAAAFVEMAKVYRQQGGPMLAEDALRQGVKADLWSFDAHFELGLLLEGQGKYPAALEALTRAWVILQYDTAPAPPLLDEALRRVDEKAKQLGGSIGD